MIPSAATGTTDHMDTAAACPFTVRRAVMLHRWETLTFLHWSFDPASVQRLLPDGLTVETADDRAWVGLVPFFMRVALPHTRSVPWVSEFCETNVRTYVHDDAGRSGIWFFSLDAARLGAVLAARASYRLPYFWSKMALVYDDAHVDYTCHRRWPGPQASCHVALDIGAPYLPDELSALDHFLTARWLLFSRSAHHARYARAQHAPWPLQRATVSALDDTLLVAAGLPTPTGVPLVHYSPGVDVRIGRPEISRA